MSLRAAGRIVLTPEQQQILKQLVQAHSTPQQLAERARIILLSGEGYNISDTAKQLGLWRKTASLWRKRWLAAANARKKAADDVKTEFADMKADVAERLSDALRSGAPATFTPENICAIIAIACEDLQATGQPISHWTHSELTREVIRRGVVPKISLSTVGRFLKGGGSQAPSHAGVADRQARSPV